MFQPFEPREFTDESQELRHFSRRDLGDLEIHAASYQWAENIWRKRSQGQYVPPLLNPDIDWEAPNIMERRAALREIPEIAALLIQANNSNGAPS